MPTKEPSGITITTDDQTEETEMTEKTYYEDRLLEAIADVFAEHSKEINGRPVNHRCAVSGCQISQIDQAKKLLRWAVRRLELVYEDKIGTKCDGKLKQSQPTGSDKVLHENIDEIRILLGWEPHHTRKYEMREKDRVEQERLDKERQKELDDYEG